MITCWSYYIPCHHIQLSGCTGTFIAIILIRDSVVELICGNIMCCKRSSQVIRGCGNKTISRQGIPIPGASANTKTENRAVFNASTLFSTHCGLLHTSKETWKENERLPSNCSFSKRFYINVRIFPCEAQCSPTFCATKVSQTLPYYRHQTAYTTWRNKGGFPEVAGVKLRGCLWRGRCTPCSSSSSSSCSKWSKHRSFCFSFGGAEKEG